MIRNPIKILLIIVVMVFPLMSCSFKEDKAIYDNSTSKSNKVTSKSLDEEENNYQVNQAIKVVLKGISQEEYDKWVVPSYDGYYDADGKAYPMPEISSFDYPYVEGMDNKEQQDKVNETIKNTIFSGAFFSYPMKSVSVGIMPWSEFEFPGVIYNNDILSIPITLYWNMEKYYYKSMSATIDMKTGEQLFLEDIIELNETFAEKMINEERFYIDNTGEIREYLYNYYDVDNVPQSEVSTRLLKRLYNYMPEEEKPKVELFYLRKDGIVLTHFANTGIFREINIPFVNLNDYLKIGSWKSDDSLELLLP